MPDFQKCLFLSCTMLSLAPSAMAQSAVSALVSRTTPANGLELVALAAGRDGAVEAYDAAALFNINVLDYQVATTIPFETAILGTVATPDGTGVPPAPGNRAGTAEDLFLNSGLNNPSVATGLVFEFVDAAGNPVAVTNAPGADIIFLERSPPVGAMPPSGGPIVLGGDPFQLNGVGADADLTAQFFAEDYVQIGPNGFVANVAAVLQPPDTPPINGLDDLESAPLISPLTVSLNLYGLGADLSALGFAEGATVSSLRLTSIANTGFAFDTAAILGLPALGSGTPTLSISGTGNQITVPSGSTYTVPTDITAIAIDSLAGQTNLLANAGLIGNSTPVLTPSPPILSADPGGSVPVIVGGAGAESVLNTGMIFGGVVLGAGDDSLTLAPGSSLVGSVNGGAGSDSARIQLGAGDGSTPQLIDGAALIGFELVRIDADVGTAGLISTLAAGTVIVETGALSIGNGAILDGTLTVDAAAHLVTDDGGAVTGDLEVAGALTHQSGAVSIGGDLLFSDGASLALALEAQGLSVTGDVTIGEGVTLSLLAPGAASGGAAFGSVTIPVAQVGGGIDGLFLLDPVTIPDSFELILTDDMLVLSGIALLDLEGVAPPGAAFGAIVNAQLSAGLDGSAVADLAASADAGLLAATLTDLAPQALAQIPVALTAQATALTDAFSHRVDRLEIGQTGLSVFGYGLASGYDRDAESGFAGFSADARGGAGGVEFTLADIGAVGLFGGFIDSEIDLTGTTDLDTGLVGVQAVLGLGPIQAGGLFSYFTTDISGARLVNSPAGLTATITESERRDTVLLHGEVAYSLIDLAGLSVQPQVELSYLASDTTTLTETFGDTAVQTLVEGRDFLFADLTARAAYALAIPGGNLVPEVALGYRIELLDQDTSVRTGILGSTATPPLGSFTGLAFDRGTVLVNAGLSARFGGVSVFARYDGQFGGASDQQQITGGVEYRF